MKRGTFHIDIKEFDKERHDYRPQYEVSISWVTNSLAALGGGDGNAVLNVVKFWAHF